ncbi:MAG: alanine--tRNA ligase [Planctomycetes bacterium]|nr:alanine--tRNA ligase [Planctomycetota bacterium]
MNRLTADEIRTRYLELFAAHGHKMIRSDSLVPANDPTLLFTGAGMNQFKDMFLGKGTLDTTRATTAQKCLRVPDLENVGVTPRHHTFFEMLGNFSFGDYFKKDCITWVWSFFKDVCGIPEDQMVVTIYADDDEAFEIWNQHIGLAADRIYRFGEKENFWPAEAPSKGPNGVCGPCSEVYFDNDPEQALPANAGLEDLPSPRFCEIGNCVFTQFDRKDGGVLEPLPQKNIDVGLGLERITAVLQGAPNNFETDLFRPYLDHIAELSGVPYGKDPGKDMRMRRIADHVRAVTFCIADGALPSNEGRGYVVRKILRRAARDGYELGFDTPFLFGMVDVVGRVMGKHYPEVIENAAQCRAVIRGEEENFLGVYRQGMARLEEFLADNLGAHSRGAVIPGSGEFAFQLHDTYGFPIDITAKVIEERGYGLDEAGFHSAMETQRERARASAATSEAVFTASVAVQLRDAGIETTIFTGYAELERDSRLLAAIGEGDQLLKAASAGETVMLVFDQTPFYAQGGGQVGDLGQVRTETGVASVRGTTSLDGFHLHEAVVESGRLEPGQAAALAVTSNERRATERNHTATHLLHAALRQVLGDHVSQAGSEVSPERLRFDYTQPEKPGADAMRAVEEIVNEQVLLTTPVEASVRSLEDAKRQGFTALFGEKYGDEVRTLQVGDFSKELCGGTHVNNTGNIGLFRIVSEGAVAAGTRRIEAVTGRVAMQMARADREHLGDVTSQLKVQGNEAAARVQELTQELKKTRKELEKALAPDLEVELAKLEAELVESERAGGTVRTVVFRRPGMQTKDAQELLHRAQQKHAPMVGVVLGKGADSVAVAVSVSKELTSTIQAGALVKELTGLMGGGGGGRPEGAQGKGKDASKLEEAVAAACSAMQRAGLRPE